MYPYHHTGCGIRVRKARHAQPRPPAGNNVTSAKYTLLSFAPVFLFETFSRVAYLYFLLQASLSWCGARPTAHGAAARDARRTARRAAPGAWVQPAPAWRLLRTPCAAPLPPPGGTW